MIVMRLIGGMGNQLFQYACGRSLARRLNTELKLDITWNEEREKSHHCYYQLGNFNIQENFATESEIKNLNVVKEMRTDFVPAVLDSADNTYLDGYWHSGKYFEEIADVIREEFTLKKELEQNSMSWREKILNCKCAVSVHIRRGDYLTPKFRNHSGAVPGTYYYSCAEELKKTFPKLTLFVFSDDHDWVKNNMHFNVPVEFVEGCEHDYEELYLMSLCKHNIISNGTFSWWSAWLNKNPDKKVFAPYPWARSGWGGETIIPDSWIKVPVDYEKNKSYAPLLSVIVCIENDLSKLAISAQSLFKQFLQDYEIIFVDNSTDGSGDACRRAVVNDKVTFLKKNFYVNKFAALNKALECAAGDYVLILTTKHFLFPNVVNELAIYLENDYKEKCNYGDVKNYLNYEQYVIQRAPDIVCSNQKIFEDARGLLTIDGIEGKRFNRSVDKPLKDLKQAESLKFDGVSTLKLLGGDFINNLISTKLFKRKFLLDNKIQFNEHNEDNSELLFVTDAMMSAKEIVFTPAYFSAQLV